MMKIIKKLKRNPNKLAEFNDACNSEEAELTDVKIGKIKRAYIKKFGRPTKRYTVSRSGLKIKIVSI